MNRLWQHFKRKSIRLKIFVYTAALIIVTALIILSVISIQVRDKMQDVLIHDLRGVHNVLLAYEKARLELLKNKAMLMSEEPRLKAALDTQDPATVAQEAEKFLQVIETDFLLLSDSNGRLMANLSDMVVPDQLSEIASINGALAGRQTVALYSHDNSLYQMISSPVAILDPLGRFNLLGTVTIGLTIGDSLLATLSELTDCTVGVMQHGDYGRQFRFSRDVDSRVLSPAEKERLAHLQPGRQVHHVQIAGEDYLAILTPFFTTDERVQLLLMTSLDSALQPILRPTQQALLIIGLVALLTSLAFSYWLSRGISSPITKLVQAAENVSQGDLETPIDVRASDEIGTLATSFEEMRRSLQQNIDNLQKTYARLMVSEKLATTGKLLAHLSHELNNPIHNIRSALEAGLKKLKASDQTMINIAYDEILRLERLVRQTLDFYRPGTGERASVNLNELFDEMIAVSRDSFLKKNITLQAHYERQLPNVKANRDQLKQVFLNLLLNARDAMPDGGDIVLHTEQSETFVFARVRDTGPGIPADKRDKIFDAFYTTKAQVSGVGLGLSVSYEIINQHGGDIFLNPDYQDGAEFVVKLPFTGKV